MESQSVLSSSLHLAKRFKWSFSSVLLLIIVGLFIFFQVRSAIQSIEYALTPPELPQYQDISMDDTQFLNPTGWPNESSDWFHNASQGTATIPVPYQWLVALEEPKNSPWHIFFGKGELFKDSYFYRLGFIKQKEKPSNPDNLPIGIAKTDSIYFPGIDRKAVAAGFTCAACHTGQITMNDKRFVVDGAPAMTDLGLLTRSLGAALGQTALSSRFSIFNGRFDRFARNVLGSNDNVLTRSQLKKDLASTLGELAKGNDVINVTEGFTRLDALNRIGNQVFNASMDRPANYAPINAPVNYPHIWSTSWFDWVQYDASIMQPLIRNTGEALGVQAFVDTKGPQAQRFASSVDVNGLVRIEKWLGGTHPVENKQFNGLRSPKWPAEFPAIDQALASQGERLYQDMCQGCHLPSVDSEQFWSDKYWQKIRYVQRNQVKETEETFLHLKVIPVEKIGTDSAQADVLTTRTVDTTGLGLNTDVCTWSSLNGLYESSKPQLGFVPLNDSATSNFGLALGAFVERTNQQWFAQNYIPVDQQGDYEGARPNCLQVGKGYKARPLNGIWATAPFLHNGSVATLYDLLSPLKDRPTFVQLGAQEFDAKHVGIVQSTDMEKVNQKLTKKSYKVTPDYKDGLFILDTRQPGNSNSGHIFDDKVPGTKNAGRIGRKLAEEEKLALIEYLKTL